MNEETFERIIELFSVSWIVAHSMDSKSVWNQTASEVEGIQLALIPLERTDEQADFLMDLWRMAHANKYTALSE